MNRTQFRRVQFKQFIPQVWVHSDGTENNSRLPINGEPVYGIKLKPGTGCIGTEYTGEGYFHAYGNEMDEDEGRLVTDTYAIVELENGTVEQVRPLHLKFIS